MISKPANNAQFAANRHPVRLLLTLAAVSCLGLACATVDNNAIAAQKTAGKAVSSESGAPVYYWYDGNKKREIIVATDKVADFSSRAVIVDATATKSSTATTKTSEVFVDAKSGQQSRALPGGVLVRFKAVTSQSQADALLKAFGTQTVRAIGGSGKSWLVHSEPGMASLELANTIYESGQVQSASPNWFKQRATK